MTKFIFQKDYKSIKQTDSFLSYLSFQYISSIQEVDDKWHRETAYDEVLHKQTR